VIIEETALRTQWQNDWVLASNHGLEISVGETSTMVRKICVVQADRCICCVIAFA